MAVKLPENIGFKEGAFGTLGAISMQGVRQADVSVGENVLIIGMGLIGELTYLILKASGVNVLGCDVDEKRIETLKGKGLDVYKNGEILENYLPLTKGIGFDKVIICASSKNNSPIEMSGEVLRKKGVVVVLGNVKMEFSRENFYKKEIDIRFSTSYGPGRYDRKYEIEGIDYPLPYVRWTLKRNIESFLRLVSDKKVDISSLISHTFKIEEFEKAYGIILGKKEIYSGILFEYGEKKEIKRKLIFREFDGKSKDKISVGVIGAGNFAKNFILPLIKERKDLELFGICTKNSYSLRELKEKYPFKMGLTDYRELLEEDFDVLLIFTRHNLHLKLLKEGLERGKIVYLEKPLSIYEEEFNKFKEALKEDHRFMVGFNRRFSRYSIEAKKFFDGRKRPLTFYYRVNCGFLPDDSWIYTDEGGGRILSEICHFLDFMVYISGEKIVRVSGKVIEGVDGKFRDNFLINVDFDRGSKGTILYTNLISEKIKKEYVEIHTHNKSAFLNDFRELTLLGRKERKISGSKDKGYSKEMNEFFKWVKNGGDSPIPYGEILNVTSATFGILKSIEKGKEIEIDG